MRPEKASFTSMFFANEYKDLSGNKGSVVKRLIVLLSLTFIALGFAIGGLEQLGKRMDNPFTNWVDLVVNYRVEKQLKPLKEHFLSQDSLDKYHLGGLIGWSAYHLTFNHKSHNPISSQKDGPSYIRRGRTVDFDGDFFREIINPNTGNIQYFDESAFDENRIPEWPCGIVVTTSLMDKLGYEPSEYPFVKHLSVSLEDGRDLVFLKVLAVVEKLPSLCDFITTNRVYGITQGNFAHYLMRNSISDSTAIRLISSKAGQAETLKEKAIKALGVTDLGVTEDSLSMDAERDIYSYIIKISSEYAPPTSTAVKAYMQSCKQGEDFADYSYLDCGDDAERNDIPHNITFSFKDLDMIRPFQQSIFAAHGVELTMEQVESSENFRLVTRLTTIMGTILFGFGLLSILLYLGNLIHGHILKIKTNLGTFKAMGLPNSALIKTYTLIALKLLAVALSISLPSAFMAGWLADKYWLAVGFSFLHWAIPVVIVLVFGVTYILIQLILNKILTATPGDLIYERLSE